MATETEANVAAVIQSAHARFTIESRPTPVPNADEIMVRNRAVAANPADWKIQEYGGFFKHYPNVLGSDVAGDVVAIGANVRHFKVGDRVTGFAGVIYSNNIDHGAWQTYTLVPELAATKLPTHISYVRGAVLPMGMITAAVALFHELGVSRDTTPSATEALLVWGAASSVGASAVQIAKVLGWKHVFVTASRKHHTWLRDLGATDLFDYHNTDIVEQIAKAIVQQKLNIERAIDSISEASTLDLVRSTVLASGGDGATIVLMSPWPEGKEKPTDVKINTSTIAARHATDLKELGRWFFNEWLERALETGQIIPAPEAEIVEGGLHAAQTALDRLKAGVSGKKLVVEVE